VVTRSELGAVVLDGKKTCSVPAFPIATLVDSTGAGDLFAAGFLAGLVRGKTHDFSARLGALAAAEVIQHVGARPQSDLQALSAQHGLLL
jgi:sugar/nucleoside kinase (ribokinase family)